MAKKSGSAGGSPVVKSGKASVSAVTAATVQRLERAGSSESAKIARTLVRPKDS